jgi:hypothetical protein
VHMLINVCSQVSMDNGKLSSTLSGYLADRRSSYESAKTIDRG